jgi:hypothetical protein
MEWTEDHHRRVVDSIKLLPEGPKRKREVQPSSTLNGLYRWVLVLEVDSGRPSCSLAWGFRVAKYGDRVGIGWMELVVNIVGVPQVPVRVSWHQASLEG